MLDLSQSEVVLSTLGILMLVAAVGVVAVRRRHRLAMEAKERRILQARRRDIKKWEELQESRKTMQPPHEEGGDQP